ncbi:MAG: [Lachnospiraceae bacterium]|nr:[FeFe] hydrogenase, group A [Lachnospiraceae bacterium]
MSKHSPTRLRVPVERDNPAVMRYSMNCISCGSCARACLEQVGVAGAFDLEKTGDRAVCTYCGQCVAECTGFAMQPKTSIAAARAAIADPSKIVIASTSPAVRVSIGEAFGLPEGTMAEGKLIALLRALGFDRVLDTNTAADMTIMEEASELVRRIREGGPLPMFTSCCPSWVRFAEIFRPEILPNISTAKSPIGMQGATVKTWYAQAEGLDPANIVHIAITPCTAKKAEILRPELNASGAGQDTDLVVTIRELAEWAVREDIDYFALEDDYYDDLMGDASGAGAIFGTTGGVMEAALRTGYYLLNGVNPPARFFELGEVRGYQGVREASVDMGAMTLNVAVIHGTANARKFLDEAAVNGKEYHFIEVMTCPGGCIGGGGQPKHFSVRGCIPPAARGEALRAKDEASAVRCSHENPQIRRIYDEFYGAPLSEKAENALHTYYTDKSAALTGAEI